MRHTTSREFLKEQLMYTVEETRRILIQLSDAYHDKISIKQHTEKFNPRENLKNFMIDGLTKQGSYVNNAFLKLTTKTNITLKVNNYADAHITFYHKNDTCDRELIRKCIKRIYCMLNVFGNKDNIKIYDEMTIDILLYHAPRIMTDKFKHSTAEINEIGKKYYFNCTCGYAAIDNNKFELCVTRKNSCLGLLVHELGHICELDLGNYDGQTYNFPENRLMGWKYLVKKYFDIHHTCHIGSMTEGINNGNSSIIHAMFIALETNTKPGNLFHEYTLCYEKEFVYAIELLGKLLRWFRYKSFGELFRKNNIQQSRPSGKYTQKSLLLEYILVRCIYLMYFNKLQIFKTSDEPLEKIDDNQYTLHFFRKMTESVKILDEFLYRAKNNGIICMEYYYHA